MCEAKSEGLVRYPNILPSLTGSSVTLKCADNAHRVSASLVTECTFGGEWGTESTVCECDAGYQPVTVNGEQSCHCSSTTLPTVVPSNSTFSTLTKMIANVLQMLLL